MEKEKNNNNIINKTLFYNGWNYNNEYNLTPEFYYLDVKEKTELSSLEEVEN